MLYLWESLKYVLIGFKSHLPQSEKGNLEMNEVSFFNAYL